MIELLDKLTIWVAKQLDYLKINNPTLFLVVNGLLFTLAVLFQNKTINISQNEILNSIVADFGAKDLNQFASLFIFGVTSLIGYRTTSFKNK
jgi:hypothetical protein